MRGVAFLLVVATGLFGVVAVMCGKWLEREHWLKDRRLEAYTDLILQLDTSLIEQAGLQRQVRRLLEEETEESLQVEIRTSGRQLVFAAGRVELLGPDRVADAASKAADVTLELWEFLLDELLRALERPDGADVGPLRETELFDEAARVSTRFKAVAKRAIRR